MAFMEKPKKSEGWMLFRAIIENYNPLVQAVMYTLGRRIEKNLGPDAEKTAILYAQTDGPVNADLMLLSTFPHLIYSEAERGRRIKAFDFATSSDLENVLKDDSFQNIFLFGHGTPFHWIATDRCVSVRDLNSWNFKRKTGEVVKLTCNDGNGHDYFAEMIAANPDNAKYFSGKLSQSHIMDFLRDRLHDYEPSTS